MPAQFLLVFVSDLGSDGRLSGAAPVDKDNFAEIMRTAAAAIAVSVRCPCAEFDSRLTFDSLRLTGLDASGWWELHDLPVHAHQLQRASATVGTTCGQRTK